MKLLAALLLLPLPALADPLALATTAAEAFCTSQGGRMEFAEGAVQRVDLTGDGTADDALVWEYGGFCGPDFGFQGGSGGAMLHVAVGDRVQSFMAGSWVLQDVAFPVEGELMPPVRVLLLARHGSACDSFGAASCVEAVTWEPSEGRFMTVGLVAEPAAP